MTADAIPPKVTEMIAAGALFAVSHSGGKDSQAQMIRLRSLVPPDQLIVVPRPWGAWNGPARCPISVQRLGTRP